MGEPMLLPKSEEIALRQIAKEPRPCQCQFNPHDVAMLAARGFVSVAVCGYVDHGAITMTKAGADLLARHATFPAPVQEG